MKKIFFLTAIGFSLVLSGIAFSQERDKTFEQHLQIMKVSRDSSLMNKMMDHIANDNHMSMKMMHKMMAQAKHDSTKMMEMCETMMKDTDMHSMMMNMMGGDMMKHNMMGKDKGKNEKEIEHQHKH